MSDPRDSWRTPPKLFEWLNERFRFTLDAAATAENTLLPKFITEEQNLLRQIFAGAERIFCNPPYSQDKEFAEHLYGEFLQFGTPSMLLLPVRTDRLWWNRLRKAPGVRVEFYTGRIHFSGAGKGAFMYNCNFIFGFDDVPLVDPIDAGQFNENGKGGATK